MNNKSDEITRKLIKLGYQKTVFNKPEKSICSNEDEFILVKTCVIEFN